MIRLTSFAALVFASAAAAQPPLPGEPLDPPVIRSPVNPPVIQSPTNPPPVPGPVNPPVIQNPINPPVVMTPAIVAPMSVRDFARSFQPAQGKYEVVLCHPKTGCPVHVCFNLPCGCAKKVTVNKHTLRIEYRGLFNDVVIRFKHDGTVSVRDA